MGLGVGLEGTETESVFGAGTELGEGGAMLGGAIADVFFETVIGVLLGESDHVLVAGDFGDNGGGGDFFDEVIGAF